MAHWNPYKNYTDTYYYNNLTLQSFKYLVIDIDTYIVLFKEAHTIQHF